MLLISLAASLGAVVLVAGLPDVIRIGGLFNTDNPFLEVAFRYSIEKINNDNSIIPSSKLFGHIEKIESADSFKASKKVCNLLKLGVVSILGPQTEPTSAHVQSICDAMEVPHIEMRWDYRIHREEYSLNLYPHPQSLSQAFIDLIRARGWKSFTIIYQDNESLVRLQNIIQLSSPKDVKVTIRQLNVGDDYRSLLKSLKKAGETRILLDCERNKIPLVLKQAQQIGMISPQNSFLITSLDLHTIDLEDYRHSEVNITGWRLIDPSDPEVEKILSHWKYGELRFGRTLGITKETLQTPTALVYDSVMVLAKALRELDRSQAVTVRPLQCDENNYWDHGSSLVNYLKLIEHKGMSGHIRFNSQGFRTTFDLDIVELTKDGLTKNDPYIMYKDSTEKLTGNNRFEGFCVDLLNEISKLLGFNYTLKLAVDGNRGNKNVKTNKWNGMIGELLEGEADLAVADLTISYDREQDVDFTMPFMNTGISILYKKATKQAPSLFSFLSPLSVDVWIYMAAAYFGVSLLLFMLARCKERGGISPYEWVNPHPCDMDPDHLENELDMSNAFWHNIGSLMQQGSDIAPKTISTRMVAGCWWFFTLIMISSYTANLAAFLTVERMDSPIESAEDLAKQTKIKYGNMESGTTEAFFRNPSVFTKSNQEGVRRVQESNGLYAFFMESTTIEYIVERRCDLTQVGSPLDSKAYGIALPPGSPYRALISGAILQLQEKNVLHILKTKWWKQKKGGGQCKDESSMTSNAANELGLANVGGVFVVLMGGIFVSFIIASCEFCQRSRKVAKEDDVSFFYEMTKEMCYALRCQGSTKPVRKKPAGSSSVVNIVSIQNEDSSEDGKYVVYPRREYGT